MKRILPILIVLLLQACSSSSLPKDQAYASAEELAEAPENPAVEALVQEADRQLASDNPQLAANALERAIRIAPRDARLRQRLAEVRYMQGERLQAKSLARMAIAYGRGQPDVQADAWEIIGRAESDLGNLDEADQAFSEAERLRDGW